MIVFRRMIAVLLAVLLVVAFAATLVISRVTATVMAPGFYVEQLRELDAYTLVHDELLPRAVDDFLKHQNEKLPDNLSGIALPTDAAAQQAILDLLRVALPPEVLRAHAEAAIAELVPYLTGAHDDFDVRIRLGDELVAVAGHAPGRPSLLEQTWRTLDLAEATLTGLVQARLEQADAEDAGEDAPGLLDVIGGDVDGASAWLERALFGAIDELVPYLTGETEHVRIVVSFDAYPALAEPFAGPLHRTPEELLTDGFVIDDREINAELAKSGRDEINNSENALAIFRPEGYSFTAQDLRDGRAARAESEGDGIALDELRAWGTRVRLARWGSLVIVAALVPAVAALGGRRWPSRLAWGASAMLVARTLAFALGGPVYSATAGGALERALAEQRADDAGTWQPLRARALDRVEAVADGSAARAAATARNWALLSVLAIAGSVTWSAYDRGRPARAPADAEAEA